MYLTYWLYSTQLACKFKVKLPSHRSLWPAGLRKMFHCQRKSDLRKHSSHTQLHLQPVTTLFPAKCTVQWVSQALCDLKTILPIVSFSQSLRGHRRANTPVIKTQTGLSLSLLSSPSPDTHRPQVLTAPNTGGDRISPQTSKHNMKIKHRNTHTDTEL